MAANVYENSHGNNQFITASPDIDDLASPHPSWILLTVVDYLILVLIYMAT
jgi:hypothetical protein